jgi:hypothetical protein
MLFTLTCSLSSTASSVAHSMWLLGPCFQGVGDFFVYTYGRNKAFNWRRCIRCVFCGCLSKRDDLNHSSHHTIDAQSSHSASGLVDSSVDRDPNCDMHSSSGGGVLMSTLNYLRGRNGRFALDMEAEDDTVTETPGEIVINFSISSDPAVNAKVANPLHAALSQSLNTGSPAKNIRDSSPFKTAFGPLAALSKNLDSEQQYRSVLLSEEDVAFARGDILELDFDVEDGCSSPQSSSSDSPDEHKSRSLKAHPPQCNSSMELLSPEVRRKPEAGSGVRSKRKPDQASQQNSNLFAISLSDDDDENGIDFDQIVGDLSDGAMTV